MDDDEWRIFFGRRLTTLHERQAVSQANIAGLSAQTMARQGQYIEMNRLAAALLSDVARVKQRLLAYGTVGHW